MRIETSAFRQSFKMGHKLTRWKRESEKFEGLDRYQSVPPSISPEHGEGATLCFVELHPWSSDGLYSGL